MYAEIMFFSTSYIPKITESQKSLSMNMQKKIAYCFKSSGIMNLLKYLHNLQGKNLLILVVRQVWWKIYCCHQRYRRIFCLLIILELPEWPECILMFLNYN